MYVIKRNGSKVDFDGQKIINAIQKANAEVPEQDRINLNEMTIQNIESTIEAGAKLAFKDGIPVEEIQNAVEDLLMAWGYNNLARCYIRYRYKREVAREYRSDFTEAIAEKLTASNVKNQNANIDEHSFGGRTGEATSHMTKQCALNFIVSDMARNNHENNEVYIHDLDAYAVGSHNCLTIPFDKLLAEGFNTRQSDIRPSNSINTAFQLIAVIFQLQSLQQFGGVSASHLDWTMVPYVRKSFFKHYKDGMKYILGEDLTWIKKDEAADISIDDARYHDPTEKVYQYAMDMTTKELNQATEAMYHNLNTLQSRSGNQLPFTSINYGTCTLPEGRMVIKSLLDASIKGTGKLHKTSIFPCGIFQCMKGVNRKPGDPNYDLFRLALKSTAKRLYPNYVNVDWSNNAGYDRDDPSTYVSTMGCRTYNGSDINAEPGVNPQTKDGRGNIAPVTIILPTLAMEADRDYDKFMILLDQKIHEARDMLLERYHWICSQNPASAKFMYENGTMEGFHGTVESAMRHGTLVIGQLGLAETLQILFGCDHTTPTGMEYAKQIERLFSIRCAEFKQAEHLNFGVYYTPAENLCYTAMEKFKKKYGVIPNVSDKDFFTNSIHVPVWKKVSPFEKIDIESQLTGYSNAGCITYVEIDSSVKNNIDALETVVNYAMDHDIPYFAVNVPNDTCLDCGYCDEFNDTCPECGSDHIQQLRRVTGYLTGNYTESFNKGKQDEVRHRVKHTGVMEP